MYQNAGIDQQISAFTEARWSDAAQGLRTLRYGTASLQERLVSLHPESVRLKRVVIWHIKSQTDLQFCKITICWVQSLRPPFVVSKNTAFSGEGHKQRANYAVFWIVFG